MLDELKSKEQLINELVELRKYTAELESSKQSQNSTEFALEESEEKFRSAFEHASIGVAIVSITGKWLKVNPSLCKILGYSANELLTVDFQAITHPEDLQDNLDALEKMLSKEINTYFMEKRYIHKEGQSVWVLVSVSTVCDLHGKPLYFISQVQDITQRKLTEEKLYAEQRMTRALLDAHHDIALLVDSDGIIFSLNEKSVIKYGKTQEELIGSCIFDQFPPALAKLRRAFIDEVVRTGKPVRHQDEIDGRHYASTLYPILNSNGKVNKIAILSHDITEYKQTEEMLKTREMQQSTVALFGHKAILQNDLSILMKDASELVAHTLNVPMSSVIELLPDNFTLIVRTVLNLKDGYVSDLNTFHKLLNQRNSLSSYVIQTEKPIVINNLDNQDRFKVNLFKEQSIKSTMLVPLKRHNQVYGTLGVYSPIERNFSDQDMHFCEAIAHILAAFIENRRAQEALKLSESYYRAIVEDQTELICRFLSDGTITFVNEACCRYFKRNKKDLIGLKIIDIKSNHQHHHILRKLKLLNIDNPTFTIEHPLPSSDGALEWVTWTSRAIFNESGNIIEFQSVGRDITEKKAAELVLLESEERYRRLVELLPDALFVDISGKFVYVNHTFLKMFKLNTSEEILGKNVLDYIHPDYHALVNNYTKEILEKGITSRPEARKMICSDGTLIDVESSATLFPYNSAKAILVAVRDISERKRAEEMRVQMEENDRALHEAIEYEKLKTEFFSNVSHELKTPLSVIFATLQLLKLNMQKNASGRSNANVDRYMHIMKQNCYRLLRLVNNIIDITRIDTNFLALQLQNYDISYIINDVTESVKEYIENRGIKLVLESDVKEKIIACDADKIERIMLNLLSNAVKFTGTGGTITVKLCDLSDKVRISVKDTGIGIPKEKLDIIFERFIQIDKSLTRNHEGSGIGLSIVKSLIEMHHGNIYALSEIGKGSDFIFELPCRTIPEDIKPSAKSTLPEHLESERINIEFSDIR